MITKAVVLTWMRNCPMPSTGQLFEPMRGGPGMLAINQGDPKLRRPSGAMSCFNQALGAQDMDSTLSRKPPLG